MSKVNESNNYGFETIALHEGYESEKSTRARAVPIYQTTSYEFENCDEARDLFSLAKEGNIYTRLNNPTTSVLEKRVSALEGGIGAVAFSSGSAAITAALLTILKNGDHIVSSSSLYGGTYNLLKVFFKSFIISSVSSNPIESLIRSSVTPEDIFSSNDNC